MLLLFNPLEDKGFHTFPKGICLKVNVIARLEHELAYYDSAVHRFNHYTTRTSKVTGRKVWTIGKVRNCLDAHLGQIVCDKDGVVDWCIVLVEMPLNRLEECWPLP